MLSRFATPGTTSILNARLNKISTCYRRMSGTQQRDVKMEAIVFPPYVPSGELTQGYNVQAAYPHGIQSMSRGTTMFDAMRRLGERFEEVPLPSSSAYVQPSSIMYEFDGRTKRWDIVRSQSSVGIVLYHTELQCFLLVRQFRPAVYAARLREAELAGQDKPTKLEGFTYELCAGLIDKDKSTKQIAKEEIHEEVGYDVPLDQIHDLGNSISSAGTSGNTHFMFFALVNESMRAAGAGGGLQHTGECIEVLSLPLDSAMKWVLDPALPKSPGAQFGVTWVYHAVKSGQIGNAQAKDGMYTEELTLKPVLPA